MFTASRIALRSSANTWKFFQPNAIARTFIKPQKLQTLNYCTKTLNPESNFQNVEAKVKAADLSKEVSQLSSVPLAQLEKKMQMIYTCKVCDTRFVQ